MLTRMFTSTKMDQEDQSGTPGDLKNIGLFAEKVW